METALRKMGNSAGVILPKAAIGKMGLTTGTRLDIAIEGERIVLTPMPKDVRAGWAEDAEAIAAAADCEAEEWLETPDEADADLSW